jgi:hypothetical protein
MVSIFYLIMFLFQLRLLKKCKFLIEKDHSEKELAVQVVYSIYLVQLLT